MSVLSNLEPKEVFNYFEQICRIPHGSGNVKQISNYLANFAKEHNLKYIQDEMQNLIIFKDGTRGYENSMPVIIQGHMDMVCEKSPECTKDMTKEGLELCVDGDTVYAKGTTLGGDDGIAVAFILAILASDTIEHPPIEALITTDEETGMFGAQALDTSVLSAKRMLNIDSEVEGVFTVSCAGGCVAECKLPIEREDFSGECVTVTVYGLRGGHSGVEIDKGRANADEFLARALSHIAFSEDIRIADICGGLKHNAIPNEASVVIVCKDKAKIKDSISELACNLKKEYAVTDKDIDIRVDDAQYIKPLNEKSTKALIALLSSLPNGIQNMSFDIEGLVQTSLNLGVINIKDDAFRAELSLRSSIESQKIMLQEKLKTILSYFGGSVEIMGDYPSWEYMSDSPLRDTMTEVFTEQYGHKPKIEAIHAGLECGLFSGKIKGLDCISIGPDLTNIHTFNEKMHIKSVQRTWKLVIETLKRLK